MKKVTKLQQFKQDWNNITLMKLFEIPVIDKRTNEQTYIIFDIELTGRSFVALHESLTKKEDRSKKIAFVKVLIDTDFSIDMNLQELYEECINSIINSDFYSLTE